MRRIVLALGALAGPALADPGWDVQQSGQCTAAITAAEGAYGTSPGLLLAIAKAESGRPVPAASGP